MTYYLIDDPLCELDEDIDTYKDCKQCPYFYDCMEVESNDEEEN